MTENKKVTTDWLLMAECLHDAWYLCAYGDYQDDDAESPFMSPESVAIVARTLFEHRCCVVDALYAHAGKVFDEDSLFDNMKKALVEKDIEMSKEKAAWQTAHESLWAKYQESEKTVKELRRGIAEKIKRDKET